jgi:hypothetical protein
MLVATVTDGAPCLRDDVRFLLVLLALQHLC